jgi:hypothetical protein
MGVLKVNQLLMEGTQGKLFFLTNFNLATPKNIFLARFLSLLLKGETRREITEIVSKVNKYNSWVHLTTCF